MSVGCPDCGHPLGAHLVELQDGTIDRAVCDTCDCPGFALFAGLTVSFPMTRPNLDDGGRGVPPAPLSGERGADG